MRNIKLFALLLVFLGALGGCNHPSPIAPTAQLTDATPAPVQEVVVPAPPDTTKKPDTTAVVDPVPPDTTVPPPFLYLGQVLFSAIGDSVAKHPGHKLPTVSELISAKVKLDQFAYWTSTTTSAEGLVWVVSGEKTPPAREALVCPADGKCDLMLLKN